MSSEKFRKLLKKDYIFFDGAMGTELQKLGLKAGEPSELFNFTAPEKVAKVVRAYAESGSDIVSANTFCANRHKLSAIGKTVDETVSKAVKIAKNATSDFSEILVALDVGSIGQLLRPTGVMTFDEAYEIFSEQILAGVKSGADVIVLQTFSDLLELKCAILAAKENSDLPVICSMTFEQNGRTFTGCPVSAYAVTASGLGADVIGVNCSLGPQELFEKSQIVSDLLKFSDVPIMVKPNAGLPDPLTGAFKLSAKDFANQMSEIAKTGVKILGGCCGTSPEYIKLLKNSVQEIGVNSSGLSQYSRQPNEVYTAVASGVKTVVLNRSRIIGERINPTGKAMFKEALKSSDTDYILGQAIEQTRAGADILDVNVGLPEIDEKKMMVKVVEALQSVCDLPLQIDSADPAVIEAALRIYNGKPIVNAVDGKKEKLDVILPLVKKYGAAVIALTLDENGIPETAQGRLEIAEKILSHAQKLGIKKEDIIVDCLTLTVSTDSKAAQTTLEAVKLVKEKLGLKTALGASNISFGLPNREIINSAFLTLALQNGLDLPIINPNSPAAIGAVRAFRLLNNQDQNAAEYVTAYTIENKKDNENSKKKSNSANKIQLSIADCIYGGLKKDAAEITARLLETESPLEIVDNRLIPALDKAGEDYEKKLIFLPQLMLCAETASVCFDIVKSKMPAANSKNKGKIVLATVKGDIHDIGKNIVKVLLESYGYKIIDLGRDVDPATVLEAAKEHGVSLVGLSALMTVTLPAMTETITLIRESGLDCKVMVGGAVLNSDYAESIGADYYAKDAKGAVDIAKKHF